MPVGKLKTKKQAIQKKLESQLAPREEQSLQIRQTNQRLEILRLIDLQYSDAEICKHLSIADVTLQKAKENIHATITMQYSAAVDNFRSRALQRFERLYRIAEAHATGSTLPGEDYLTITPGVAQRDWMKVSIEILAKEADLLSADIERAQKREEESQGDVFNLTEIRSVTMTRSSSLAGQATEALAAEWGQDDLLDYIYTPDALLPAQIIPQSDETLLEDLDPSEIHRQLTDLQHRLYKVQLEDEGASEE